MSTQMVKLNTLQSITFKSTKQGECVKLLDANGHYLGVVRLLGSAEQLEGQTPVQEDKEVKDEQITQPQKERLLRMLAMPELPANNKDFIRRYLLKRGLTKAGARKVIFVSVQALKKQGVELNLPKELQEHDVPKDVWGDAGSND